MKKAVLVIVGLVIVLVSIWLIYDANCTHGVYRIDIEAECISNNSVGNEWEKLYTMDGKEIRSGEKLTLPLNETISKTIEATITEIDKISDVGSKNITLDIINGNKTSVDITVYENGGRYIGNTAEWRVTVSVKLIKKVM